jgi:hypothetical protein
MNSVERLVAASVNSARSCGAREVAGRLLDALFRELKLAYGAARVAIARVEV